MGRVGIRSLYTSHAELEARLFVCSFYAKKANEISAVKTNLVNKWLKITPFYSFLKRR